jgi:hypothetical protein
MAFTMRDEYVLQRVTERVWWVSRHFYGSLFYVGKRGVLLLDPFLGGADATLAGLDADAKSRLLSALDNHFGLYLYGRQVLAGEQPSRSGGNPFQGGAIGEWTAQRAAAVDEAVPRIIERLRPKYGRMYSFDDAQPGNVRLMAMSVQPSLTNR